MTPSMILIIFLLGPVTGMGLIVYGILVSLGLNPASRPKPCWEAGKECGTLGWMIVRQDFYTEHRKCVRCEWVSHFEREHTTWQT